MNNLLSRKNSYRLWESSLQYHFVPLLTIAVCLLSFGEFSPAAAYEAHQYKNITQSRFSNCIRDDKGDGGYSRYNGGNTGTVELRGYAFNLYVATLRYSFNPQNGTLNYSLTDKNNLVGEGQIWDGIDSTVIKKCGGSYDRRL